MSNRHTRGTSSTPAWRPSPRTTPCRVQRAHDGRIVGDLASTAARQLAEAGVRRASRRTPWPGSPGRTARSSTCCVGPRRAASTAGARPARPVRARRPRARPPVRSWNGPTRSCSPRRRTPRSSSASAAASRSDVAVPSTATARASRYGQPCAAGAGRTPRSMAARRGATDALGGGGAAEHRVAGRAVSVVRCRGLSSRR